jgi:hypothetical protein
MTKRTSKAYIMTADVNSVNDMRQIEIVRKTVSSSNAQAMFAYKQAMRFNRDVAKPNLFRVVLKARLGKNNPAYAAKYKNQWIKSIKLEDAARIDVYVHAR